MVFRAIVIIATLLIGLGGPGSQAFAQYYPPQVYPPPRAYPTPPGPPYRPLPPVDADGDEPQRPYSVGVGVPRAGAAGSRHVDQDDPRDMAALPPEVRPETGPQKSLPPQFRRTLVDYYTKEPAGTIIVDTPNTYLYLVLGKGTALRYGIGVGREGFTWAGAEKVSKMAEWPDWHPPEEMIDRQPYLPRFMAGGDGNPLGARALYLGKTLYRIHGTNQPSTIGTFVSSGCIRLTNEDITDLHSRVKVGTRVVVLPVRDSATTGATSVGSRETGYDRPANLPSTSDLPTKRLKPPEIAATLRQVDTLVAQGQSLTDAVRQTGITAASYHRWRQEVERLKNDQAKRPEEPRQEAPKRIVEGDAGHHTAPRSISKPETTGFEE